MTIAEQAENTLLGLLVMCGLAAWTVAFVRLQRGQEIIPYEPRRPVPWDLVGLAPVMLYIAMAVASVFLPQKAPPEDVSPKQLLASLLIGQLVMLALQLGLVILRSRAQASDLGVDPRRLPRDMQVGALAFLGLAPIVFAIQALLVQYSPSKHPLMEILERDKSPSAIILIVVSAVILAPVLEELMFRVVLQGWLEKCFAVKDGQLPPASQSNRIVRAYAPIAISAAIFALMHLRFHDGMPNPDPVPLFVFAVGLGYLYRQTHRIWASLAVHALLNACSMAIVLIQLFNGQAK